VGAVPPERFTATLGLVTVAALALAACGSSSGGDGPPTVGVRLDGAEVRAEVAADDAAREQGLAGRESLPEDRGLLFVYPDRRRRTFWMKGVRFPIDIIWIERGRVTGIERDVPVPRGDLPLYPSDRPADRVLEVPAGWAARHGVRAGARVSVEG
jgi:uncharacterized membrane protein (UPF0127 family)